MGKRERERKAKRALAPKAPVAKRPAAGSGNPASSDSSGGVEAEREPARVFGSVPSAMRFFRAVAVVALPLPCWAAMPTPFFRSDFNRAMPKGATHTSYGGLGGGGGVLPLLPLLLLLSVAVPPPPPRPH